jgi:hypothetical protein
MSHIYEALKKLDQETTPRRLGWGPIGKEVLKPDPRRPRKKISSYFIPVLFSVAATAGITYGVALKSDLLWKSPSTGTGNSSASGMQVAQIPPGAVETTKIPPSLPPEPGSLPRSTPSTSPSQGTPDRKSTIPPLISGSSPKGPSLPSAQPAAAGAARKNDAAISPGSPQKVPSFPRVQSPAPQEEDPDGSYSSSENPVFIPQPPKSREELQRLRLERLEAYRREREAQQRSPAAESRPPVPPATEVVPSPRFIPRTSEVPPAPSPQAAAQSSKTSAGGQPRLKISGIVWHEQPAQRRAVINGTFAAEGSQIEGVKIVEILPTRVRFSYKNQVFELSAFE